MTLQSNYGDQLFFPFYTCLKGGWVIGGITIAILMMGYVTSAQDTSLLQSLDASMIEDGTTRYVSATFKGTRVINTHSVETPGKSVLQLMILHRFGKINEGGYQLFGLDNATMRMGFDYGISDRITVGIGRSTLEKTYDGYVKAKIVQQTENSERMPLSVTGVAGINHYTLKFSDKPYLNSKYRTNYAFQLLIARKINRRISLQLSPTWLHYNLVPTVADNNDVLVIGAGARAKITKRASFNLEYNYLPANQVASFRVYHSFSAGFDIETGGHVFQMHVTNSQGMVEPVFLGRTTGSWGKGDIYFGFNMSRVFNMGGRKK